MWSVSLLFLQPSEMIGTKRRRNLQSKSPQKTMKWQQSWMISLRRSEKLTRKPSPRFASWENTLQWVWFMTHTFWICLDDASFALEASGISNRCRSGCAPCTYLAMEKTQVCVQMARWRRDIALNCKHYLAVLWETVWRINPGKRQAWSPRVNYMPSFIRNLLASKDLISACASADYNFAGVESS